MTSTERSLVSSGLDWLTITKHEGANFEVLARFGREMLDKYSQTEPIKKWSGLGYSGRQCGPIKVGVRNGSETILMIAGEDAAHISDLIPACCHHATRVDVQLTVALNKPVLNIASDAFEELSIANVHRKQKRYLKLIKSSTGQTLYVGKRSSATVLRLYDKTDWYSPGENGLYWRYEVEFKKGKAENALKAWRSAKNRASWAVSVVSTEFEKRGISPGLPIDVSVNAIETAIKVSNDEARIEWLRKCVSPVVTQLCFNGRTEEVVAVLRLRELLANKEFINGTK